MTTNPNPTAVRQLIERVYIDRVDEIADLCARTGIFADAKVTSFAKMIDSIATRRGYGVGQRETERITREMIRDQLGGTVG